VKTTARYLLVGIWNSVFGVGIFLILSLSLPELSDSLILLISYLVSIVQAHFMQRKFVWSSTERYFQELVRFSGAYISQFVANLILLQIFVRFIGLNRSVSQVIIVVLLTVVMFFVNKNGVFRVK
jgi:putative flippase GtrA